MQKKLLFFSLLLFGLSVPIFGMEKRPSQGADPYMWLDLLRGRSLTWQEVPPIYQRLLLDEARKTPDFLEQCLGLGGEESIPFFQLHNEVGKKEANRLLSIAYTPPPSVLGFLQQRQPVLDGYIQNLMRGESWENIPHFYRGAVQRYARETKREGYVLRALKDYCDREQIDKIIQQLDDRVPWDQIPKKDREAIRRYAMEHELHAMLDVIDGQEESP